jgi:hypothetical protein
MICYRRVDHRAEPVETRTHTRTRTRTQREPDPQESAMISVQS